MKYLPLAAIGMIMALGVGCGTNPPPSSAVQSHTLTIAWTDDGNPLVPVCTEHFNCKQDITIHDKTTGVEVTVPITSLAYVASNPSDAYEVRVNGFDGNGNAISSVWEVVAVK